MKKEILIIKNGSRTIVCIIDDKDYQGDAFCQIWQSKGGKYIRVPNRNLDELLVMLELK